jgi:hypothetical protein
MTGPARTALARARAFTARLPWTSAFGGVTRRWCSDPVYPSWGYSFLCAIPDCPTGLPSKYEKSAPLAAMVAQTGA